MSCSGLRFPAPAGWKHMQRGQRNLPQSLGCGGANAKTHLEGLSLWFVGGEAGNAPGRVGKGLLRA